MAGPKPLSHSLAKTVRAAVVFVVHVALGMVIVTGIWASELYFGFLWGAHPPLFFGRVPLKWLFDAADIAVMLIFIFWGAFEANQKLRGK